MAIDPPLFRHIDGGLAAVNVHARFNFSTTGFWSPCCFPILVVLIAFIIVHPLYAGDGIWTSNATGLWSDGANWSGGTVANGSGYTANFGTIDTTGDVTVHLDSARTIGNLTFGDTVTSSAGGWILDNNGTAANILTLAGGTPTITVNQLRTGKTATIGLEITGTTGFVKMGVGTLILSVANTYAGTTTASAGTLAYSADNVISTGAVTVNGGTLSMGSYSDTVGTVTVDGGGSITGTGTLTSTDSFEMRSGTVRVGLAGSGITLNKTTSGTVTLYGNNTYTGTTTISGGILSNNSNIHIGNTPGSTDSATVTGIDSKWNSNGDLHVGHSGNGTLSITSGGKVNNDYGSIGYSANSTGSVTVAGSGSAWLNKFGLYVGYSGDGALEVSGGGRVNAQPGNQFSYIGYAPGSIGNVTVNGVGSTWSTYRNLHVGGSGNGVLCITDGGYVTNEKVYVGDDAGSTGSVTVDGADSRLNNFYKSYIGWNGNGTLNIINGGSVSGYTVRTDSYIGYGTGSTGSVTVSGVGSTWDHGDYGDLDIGYSGRGTLVIANGATVSDYVAAIGFTADSEGSVTVSGNGSLWSTHTQLIIGRGGNGSLSILNGAVVDIKRGYGDSCIGYESGSTGTVLVDGLGSVWNCKNLKIGGSGNGRLRISDGGVVNVQYPYGHSYIGSGGSVTVTGTSSTWNANYGVEVGGALQISHGGTVTSLGSLSSDPDSIGTASNPMAFVTVEDAGSSWTNNCDLDIGHYGNATLRITEGAVVSNDRGSIGNSTDPTGSVTVSGGGSRWINNKGLGIGSTGTLKMAAGGCVTATSVSISSQSLLAMDVGNNSQLTIDNGSGAITNDGTLRILAGAGAVATTYTPILATTFTNNGTWQAIGGTWDAGSHQFTVSTATIGSSGTEIVEIDLDSTQRVLVGNNDWSAGASFLTQSSTIDFTATAISGTSLTSLRNLLATGDSVLSGWGFMADNYTVSNTNPVYLSLKVGSGHSLDDLDLWRYTLTGGWQPYTASDLTYDGTYASFTVTGFTGYAVSGLAVPEPSAIILLSIGAASLLAWCWQQRRRTR